MLPEDVIRLRHELKISISELARALGLSGTEVAAWEAGERFPTRRAVERMDQLRAQAAAPPHGAASPVSPEIDWAALADPELWAVFRKLAASPELRARVIELTQNFPDPAGSSAHSPR